MQQHQSPFPTLPKTHPSAKTAPPKPGQTFWAKAALLGILTVAAAALFGWVCSQTFLQYQNMWASPNALLGMGLWIFGSAFLLVIFSGLAAALIRPVWVSVLIFLISAVALTVPQGINTFTAVMALMYFAACALFVSGIVKKMANQINFSIHPIGEGQKLLMLVLFLIASANFALGYMDDAARNNFVVPPQLRQIGTDTMVTQEKAMIAQQINLPAADQTAAIQTAQTSTAKTWSDLETQLKPFLPAIALMLWLCLFTTLETVGILLAWIPLLLLEAIFPLLNLMHFTGFITETKEIKRITIAS
jgi:hypothetical protein